MNNLPEASISVSGSCQFITTNHPLVLIRGGRSKFTSLIHLSTCLTFDHVSLTPETIVTITRISSSYSF